MAASSDDLSLSAYQYVLPPERIAQNPVIPRDSSRLLVVDDPHTHRHQHFRDLPDLLAPGDLLVLNDTRVIPARLAGYKPSGGKVEVLLIEAETPTLWLALVRPGRRLKPGAEVHFGPDPAHPLLTATVQATDPETHGRLVQFHLPPGESLLGWLDQVGEIPLPPYITESTADADQYQTVYAQRPGAVAAPTAGLHFTPDLFQRLDRLGVQRSRLTLHVGVGTFRPVEADAITEHTMHSEWIDVPAATVEAIAATKAQGGRVIAVGTTVVRALEGAAATTGTLQPMQGKTNLFIYPGFQFRVIDGLITNFHLPGSSLLMLVSALTGRERLLALYEEAIQQNYRFYSFGDAMIILPAGQTR